MSVQNNLKKPVFTKTMLGYNPKEVDQYIDYMNERYAAVSRDVSELKRRLTRLQLGLDVNNEEDKPTATAQIGTGFTDDAIDRLRHMIEAERSRHEEALDALVSFIEAHSHGEAIPEKAPRSEFMGADFDADDGFVPLPDEVILSEEDEEWEEALEGFIADTGDDTEEICASDEAENDAGNDSEEYADAEAVFAAPVSGAYLDGENGEDNTKAESAPELPEKKKTPAEIAAELDFYSDTVVQDGESYDPMTLAQSSTMKRRHPTYEDFMNPLSDSDEHGKKR